MNVDLHMHTTCSDGVYTPEELTKMALERHIRIMSITDHDTVAAYEGHRFAPGVTVIPGIEMSSEWDCEDVHILGLRVDPKSPVLVDYGRRFRKRRLERAMEMVDKCIALGYELDRKALEERASTTGTVGRPHIARLLVAKGYFPDVHAVFDELLYRNGPAYVPYRRHSIDECIDIIHAAKGYALLAHPGLLKRTLQQVLTHSFDGLEVYHPNNRGRFDEFLHIAKQRKWLISGGSDFHGTPGRYPERLGEFSIEKSQVSDVLVR